MEYFNLKNYLNICKTNSLGNILVLNKKYKLGIDSGYNNIFKDFNNNFGRNTEKELINMYINYKAQTGGNSLMKAFKGLKKSPLTSKIPKSSKLSHQNFQKQKSSPGFLSGLFTSKTPVKSLPKKPKKNSLLNIASSGLDLSSLKSNLTSGIQQSFLSIVPEIKKILESFGPEIQSYLQDSLEQIQQQIYSTLDKLINEKLETLYASLKEEIETMNESNKEEIISQLKQIIENDHKSFLQEFKDELDNKFSN